MLQVPQPRAPGSLRSWGGRAVLGAHGGLIPRKPCSPTDPELSEARGSEARLAVTPDNREAAPRAGAPPG